MSRAERKSGRPTKLTPEIQQTICDALEVGNYVETAAALAGLHKDTIYDWLKKGARARVGSQLRSFSDAARLAISRAEESALAGLRLHGLKDPRVQEWFLERRFPDRWGPRQRIDLGATGKMAEDAVIKVKLKLGGTE